MFDHRQGYGNLAIFINSINNADADNNNAGIYIRANEVGLALL